MPRKRTDQGERSELTQPAQALRPAAGLCRAIVLAGGEGVRLRPYTAVIPKPLMPVGDRPVLDIVVRQLRGAGFERITIATGYLAALVEAFFGDGRAYGIPIDYMREHEPLGTVGALAFLDDLDAPFLVMNGDVLTDLDYRTLFERHVASDAIATIATTTTRVDVSLGVLELDEEEPDRLVGYIEKPTIDVDASMGVYCFSPRVLDYIEPGEHLDFPDLVLRLLARGEVVRSWKPRAYWLDIGRHEDHERAVLEFERNRSRFIRDEQHAIAPRKQARVRRSAPRTGARTPRRALVTGGAGFIGSSLVSALLAAGHRVSVVDNLVTGRRENVAPEARLRTVDVSDLRALERVFSSDRPDVVFHLAGQRDERLSLVSPSLDASVNVCGTAAVLEIARAHGVERVVAASTASALYGATDTIPTPESAALRPLSPYGTSQAAAEAYCALYAQRYGLSTISLRLANVYGPGQERGFDAGVVAAFCAAALDGGRVTVFGDGRQTRDFVHIDDAVAALLAAGESDARGAFNAGTGVETSILSLVDALELTAAHAPPRPGEVERSCLDPGAAYERLAWRASTPLASGLESTLLATQRALARGEPARRRRDLRSQPI